MILVTGAAGFIGSHLVGRLLAEGREVVGLDNFDPFYDRSVKEANLADAHRHPGFRFVEADIRDPGALAAVSGGGGRPFRCVVHLAARCGVRPSIADPAGYHEVNLNGTLHLLEWARKRGVGQFVFASSSSVYGLNPRVPWREDDRDLQPISPYASTKLACELTGHVYASQFGIRFIALRFFTVYGPRQRPDLAIAAFTRRLLAGEPLPFFGDGTTSRDYTFVDDIVGGIVRAVDYRGSPFEIINLGNHRTVSLDELVSLLGRVFQVEPRLERLPVQPGDVPQTWADVGRARQLLGWEPQTSLLDGLRTYRDWVAGHRAAGAAGKRG